MGRTLWVVGCALVAGCGLSEKEFEDEYAATYCASSMACAEEQTGTGVSIGFESQADCEVFVGTFLGLGVAGCDYDAGAAKSCLADLEGASCDALGGTGSASCDEVYSGDSCQWAAETTPE